MALRDAVLTAPTAKTDLGQPMRHWEVARTLVHAALGRADHGLDPKSALRFRQKIVAANSKSIWEYAGDGGVVYRKVVRQVVRESPELVSEMHPQFPVATVVRKQYGVWFMKLSNKMSTSSRGSLDGIRMECDSERKFFFFFA